MSGVKVHLTGGSGHPVCGAHRRGMGWACVTTTRAIAFVTCKNCVRWLAFWNRA